MKRTILVAVYLAVGLYGFSQSALDSLVALSNRTMMTDRESFFEVSDEIIALSKTTENDSMLIEAYMSRAMVHFLAREYTRALSYYDTVLQTAPGGSREFMEARIGTADIYPKLNYPDSLINRTHLSIIGQILPGNDSLLIASEFSNYSNYLVNKARYYEGIQYLIQSIEYTPERMSYNRLMNLMKLSRLFLHIQDVDKAEFYGLKAKQMAESRNYQISRKSLALLLGRIALLKKDYRLSDSLLTTALAQFKKDGPKSDVFASYLYLANLALAQNKPDQTSRYLDSAGVYKPFHKDEYNRGKYFLLKSRLNLTRKDHARASVNLDSIRLIRERAGNIFLDSEYFLLRSYLAEDQQNYRESLHSYKRYQALQDSLFQFRTSGLIYDLESKYQNQEKVKEIELLTTKNELIGVKLDHERWLKQGFLVFALVSLLFLIFLGITYVKVRAKNELIRKTAAQKDILLKEIHHRVKNNLQLISSLLNLQARYITDEKAKQVSLEGKTRVRAMSLIHQFLYQNDELMHLSLDDYFRKLVRELLEIYRVDGKEIRVEYHIEPMDLDVDRVIPLGLIFNELMTNIFKYAFPENRHGEVRILLHRENGILVMEVSDNGIGFDVSRVREKNDSFGFTLIEALLGKWKGKLEIHNENGTRIRILIPDSNEGGKN